MNAPSKFFWYELITSDQDAAARFYETVVGWTSADQQITEMGDFRYTIFSAEERAVGGLMELTAEMRAHGARPAWFGYVHVDDPDAAARKIVDGGGSIVMGPDDIPNVGRFALVADPGGAKFYIMKPVAPPDAPPAATGSDQPGPVGWHELYAGNGEKSAFDFYSAQFGWETADLMDMGPMGQYRLFSADGAPIGGMMDKPADVPVAAWGFYFNVAGIDAAIDRITDAGGKIVTGPMEVPGGQWIVQAIDPQGAFFALVSAVR